MEPQVEHKLHVVHMKMLVIFFKDKRFIWANGGNYSDNRIHENK